MTNFVSRILSRRLLRSQKTAYSSGFPKCQFQNSVTQETNVFEPRSAIVADHLKTVPLDNIKVYDSPDFFNLRRLCHVKDLFEARVHYGHVESSLDPSMRRFIFGSRFGHLIIDLEQTAELLYQALNFAAYIAYNNGIILFIGRNPEATTIIENTAIDCKEYCHTRPWRSGLLMNPVDTFGKDIRVPDLCIFLSTLDGSYLQHQAVLETARMCIPSIAIVDTNCDRRLITYPIPGNDDTLQSITLFCSLFKEAIFAGKQMQAGDQEW